MAIGFGDGNGRNIIDIPPRLFTIIFCAFEAITRIPSEEMYLVILLDMRSLCFVFQEPGCLGPLVDHFVSSVSVLFGKMMIE